MNPPTTNRRPFSPKIIQFDITFTGIKIWKLSEGSLRRPYKEEPDHRLIILVILTIDLWSGGSVTVLTKVGVLFHP